MKFILVAGLMVCLMIPVFHATGHGRVRAAKSAPQSPGDGKTGPTDNPIEVKTDRFSNVTTVTLKPQVIFEKSDHFITIEINTKLGEKKFSDLEREMVQAYVAFESQSKGLVDFGDEELHFIINGQSLNLGKSEFKTIPYASRSGKLKPDFKLLELSANILDRPNLEQFSKANHIEMRLGPIETTLSNQLVANLREYANQVLTQHKIAKDRQQ
jgi:hypothetical protein